MSNRHSPETHPPTIGKNITENQNCFNGGMQDKWHCLETLILELTQNLLSQLAVPLSAPD